MAEEERQTLSGDEVEKQHGGQQGEAGPSEAAAAGGVFRQERLRRLVQRIIWGTVRRSTRRSD